VFTDVIPVNANLEPLDQSFWKFKKLDPAVTQNLNQSLVCPVMLGCASGMNRALVKMATPVPVSVTGHDWWALLVALVFGVVRYSPSPSMLYRLHGNNQSNQKKVSISNYLIKNDKLKAVRHGVSRRMDQGQALIDRFGDAIDPTQRRILDDFVSIASQGFVQRRISLLKGNYLFPDLQRNLAMIIGM
jgi:hypothetical protein